MSPARTTACSRWTFRGVVRTGTVAAFAALALPAVAADLTHPDSVSPPSTNWLHPAVSLDLSYGMNLDGARRAFGESRFVNELWLPKMSNSLSRVGAGDLATYPGRPLHEELYAETVTDRTYRNVQRATTRALKEYMLEEAGVTELLNGMGRVVERSKLGNLSRKTLGIDFGVSHLAPELSFRPRLSEGMMRITVRATGTVGFHYRTSRLGRGSRVGAKLDPLDQEYSLNYLLDF